MNPFTRAVAAICRHKLLWLEETVLLILAAAHVPLWLWLPVSSHVWLALHVILPVTLAALLWFAWRLARRTLSNRGPVSWLSLAGSLVASALLVWALLSVVPVFPSVELQTASFVLRALLGAALSTALLLLPFTSEEDPAR